MTPPEYTQGVCEDGCAILRDGKMLSIDEVLAIMNASSEVIDKAREWKRIRSDKNNSFYAVVEAALKLERAVDAYEMTCSETLRQDDEAAS